jgi:hypothetical protein
LKLAAGGGKPLPADIERAREAAILLLLEQNPAVMPVQVPKLRFPVSILFDSMEGFCRVTNATMEQLSGWDCLQDGCTLVINRKGHRCYLVLYHTNQSGQRLNFTLAHEAGHILLGHTGDGDREEREANAFAAELLMPRILARELMRRFHSQTEPAQELAYAFSTSLAVAKLRLKTLAGHPTPLEQRLLRRYGPILPDPVRPDILSRIW